MYCTDHWKKATLHCLEIEAGYILSIYNKYLYTCYKFLKALAPLALTSAKLKSSLLACEFTAAKICLYSPSISRRRSCKDVVSLSADETEQLPVPQIWIYTSGRPKSSSFGEQMQHSCFSLKAGKRGVTRAWISSACSALHYKDKNRGCSQSSSCWWSLGGFAPLSVGTGHITGCNLFPVGQGGSSVCSKSSPPAWYGEEISNVESRHLNWGMVSGWMCPGLPGVKHGPWLIWHAEGARNTWLGGNNSSKLGCYECTSRCRIQSDLSSPCHVLMQSLSRSS